jgi:hypothetical protein
MAVSNGELSSKGAVLFSSIIGPQPGHINTQKNKYSRIKMIKTRQLRDFFNEKERKREREREVQRTFHTFFFVRALKEKHKESIK